MQFFHGSKLVIDASRVCAIGIMHWPDYTDSAIIAWVDGREMPMVLWEPPPFTTRPDLDPERAVLCEAVGQMANKWADGEAHICVPEDMILAAYADAVRKQREEWERAAAERAKTEKATESQPESPQERHRWHWPWRKREVTREP